MRRFFNVEDMGCVVHTTGGAVRQENIERHNELHRQAEQKRLAEAQRQAAAASQGTCPFKDSVVINCDGDKCALFDGGCALKRPAARDTQGKRCPISHSKCSNHCALYFNGCGLTSIFTTKGE